MVHFYTYTVSKTAFIDQWIKLFSSGNQARNEKVEVVYDGDVLCCAESWHCILMRHQLQPPKC